MNLEQANEYIRRESETYDEEFREIPKNGWPHGWKTTSGEVPFKVLRNRHFLVQLFRADAGVVRITVNKTQLISVGRWADGITWDELQDIKTKVGYGHRDAVEIFPRDEDLVNIANMRHLWVLPEHSLNFIWRSPKDEPK